MFHSLWERKDLEVIEGDRGLPVVESESRACQRLLIIQAELKGLIDEPEQDPVAAFDHPVLWFIFWDADGASTL